MVMMPEYNDTAYVLVASETTVPTSNSVR